MVERWISLSFLLLSLGVAGCGGGSSRGSVAFGFEFGTSELEGGWSGTRITTDAAAGTLYLEVDDDGFVTYGLTGSLDEIVDGYLVFTDPVLATVELYTIAASGLETVGYGVYWGDAITLDFNDSRGRKGKISLARGFGSTTFRTVDFAGAYDLELFDPKHFTLREGFVVLDSAGWVVDGAVGFVSAVGGRLDVLDGYAGIYGLRLVLADGEVIFIDGVASLYDGILGGIYDDDFTVGGRSTLRPR